MSESFFQNLDPHALKFRFNISEEELEAIGLFGKEAKKHLDPFIEAMYQWMPSLREFRKFFETDSMLPHAKAQQKLYWQIFFQGKIDQDYVKNRTNIGFAHARINLPFNTYCAEMNFSIEWWLNQIPSILSKEQDALFVNQAFLKIACLDIALITEAYNQLMNDNVNGLLNEKNSMLDKVTLVAEAIAIGDFSQNYKSTGDQDKRLAVAINQMTDNLKDVVKQTKVIAMGRYDVMFNPLSEKDELGKAVNEMTKILRDMSIENKKSGWIKTGQAELSNIIRGDQDIRELGKNVISFLIKYLGALTGTIYQVDIEENQTLEMIGSYAYHRRKGDRSKIKFGEGLIGQCALEKEVIVFHDVPDDYMVIGSSLGETKPRNILVLPLTIEKELIGALEIGFNEILDNSKLDLLRQVSENIAIAIKSSQNNEKMKNLLEESRRQSEELQSQQEELRCTNEELQFQQAKLRDTNEELEKQATILKQSEEEIKAKNDELKEKTLYLEKQSFEIQEKSQFIEKAKEEVEKKAKELETASKYKSEFLANMSHELRTPLNSLLILSKSLADNSEGNLTEEQKEAAAVINKGGHDLLSLINDILDLSKVEAGKLEVLIEETSIPTILDHLKRQFAPIAKDKGLEFIQFLEDIDYPFIKSDYQRIEQILKNFLSNAFKFTQKGKVTIAVHMPPPGTVFNASHLGLEKSIGFSVIDTGIGIAPDKQQLIFEAFHQGDGSTNRKYGGTGLGLSISREMSKLLSGEIHLKSEPEKGSTFTLYLPYEKEEKRKIASEKVGDDRQTLKEGDNTLLIIEDDPAFCKILKQSAKRKGYHSLVAQSGKEGLELAEKYRPTGITLDLNLPDVEGRTVLDSLKRNLSTAHIPVHIISFDENKNDSLRKGAIGHLTKPVKTSDIEKAFSNIESIHQKTIKNILIVEDSQIEQKELSQLIGGTNIALTFAELGETAIQLISTTLFDCIILDLQLPDITGFEVLRRLGKISNITLPPVIIYTSRDLTQDEYQELNEYTSSFVLKGSKSNERLLEELSIFLHRVSILNRFSNTIPKEEISTITINNNKILIVDDDMRNTFALSSILKKKGFQIAMADNGQMALEKLKKEPDIELVLMDIMMPIMDGFEAIRHIRSMQGFNKLPIIALTAKTLPEDRTKALNLGANDYLTKPVDIDELLNLIKIWLTHSLNLART